MKELTRGLVAGSIGAAVAVTVVVGQPALAEVHAKAAAKNSVTSKSIKDGTVRTKDLAPEVSGPLAKAGTALQSVPDGSVGSAKVADHSLRAADLAVRTGVEPMNWPSLAPGNCVAGGPIETGHVVTGDFLLVSAPAGIAGNLQFSVREDPTVPTAINLVECNNGNSAFDAPPANYSWAVIDH